MDIIFKKEHQDQEAFLQVMEGLQENERKMNKVQDRLDHLNDYIDETSEQRNNLRENIKHLKEDTHINERISEKEEMQRLSHSLANLNEDLKSAKEEAMSLENDLSHLETRERTQQLNNAEMIMKFMLSSPVETKQKKIDFNVDTHKLNGVKAEIAEKLHKFKLAYPKKAFIHDEDANKQKFINMIENVILKPDNQIIQDRLDELYGVYDDWKKKEDTEMKKRINQQKLSNNTFPSQNMINPITTEFMGEVIDWLYEYNVFTRDEATTAKQASFKNMFNK